MLLKERIYGLLVSYGTIDEVVEKVISQISKGKFGYICAVNVHMVMEAYESETFKNIVNNALVACPDGMPLVWGLKKRGHKNQTRICGFDLCMALCTLAENSKFNIGLIGGSSNDLQKACNELSKKFKNISIVYKSSAKIESTNLPDNLNIVKEINESNVDILFVALGCPKQELWMASQQDSVRAVMVGIGAVIEFLSGSKNRAPSWMQSLGLEWLHRFIQEPKRLFRRYVVLNSRFLYLSN